MFIPRNDEQIKAGTTTGLVAGSSSFTFDGTSGKPDYRGYEIVVSELTGRGILVRGLDYSWDYVTGEFNLLAVGDTFGSKWFNIHFENPVVPVAPVVVSSMIDTTYFIRNIMIPNVDVSIPSNAASVEKLNYFIQKYESECLIKILGYELYKKVLTESSSRITELVYGAEYTNSNNLLVKWNGLVQPSVKISLIANYIFFYYEEYKAKNSTQTGTGVANQEAGFASSPAEKMAKAWNFFSEETKAMSDFLWTKTSVYPEFSYNQMYETLRISRKIDSVFSF